MPYKIEHRVGIAAPKEVIWDILADVSGWPDWNPTYPKASGVIRIGEALSLIQALPGQKPEAISARVIDWVPYEQLHWGTSAGSGLVKILHYIEIEALSDEGCIFSSGEIFGGLLGEMAAKAMRRPIRGGFEAFNNAMREKAEATYAAMEKPRKAKAKTAPLKLPALKSVKPAESMLAFGRAPRRK